MAWNSDGLQALDLTNRAHPVAGGQFIPPDTWDPTGVYPFQGVRGRCRLDPAKKGSYVVITDINSGLYGLGNPG